MILERLFVLLFIVLPGAMLIGYLIYSTFQTRKEKKLNNMGFYKPEHIIKELEKAKAIQHEKSKEKAYTRNKRPSRYPLSKWGKSQYNEV